MTKQQITIEVDVPEGWEFVEFRNPKAGEFVLEHSSSGVPEPYQRIHDARVPAFVLARTWQWPAWLQSDWIAMDDGGDWYGYDIEPSRDEESWTNDGEWVRLTDNMLDFTPPHCTDWRQSKRRRLT